jgi:hypothetical protein
MARPEDNLYNAVARRLKTIAKRHPLFFTRTHGDGRSKKGMPDVRIVFYGISIDIELKVPGNEATAKQLDTIEKIRKAGGFAFVCYSADHVNLALIQAMDWIRKPAAKYGYGVFVCKGCRRPVYGAVVGKAQCECGGEVVHLESEI